MGSSEGRLRGFYMVESKARSGWHRDSAGHRKAALKGKRGSAKARKKLRIRKMLNIVEKEIGFYKETRNDVWLCQLSKKIWVAYNLFIEYLTGRELRSRLAVKDASWNLINSGRIERIYFCSHLRSCYKFACLDVKLRIHNIYHGFIQPPL